MAEYKTNHLFMRYLESARRYEKDWRKGNEKNFEYFDGEQWNEEEKVNIEMRGQQPTVINTIAPTIDMVCSVANDRQCDIQVCGREGSDDNKAILLTELLKHTFDNADFDYYRNKAFRDAVIGGRAWFECGIFTDERGKDLVKIDCLPWENVYVDPFSRKPDASDARFIIKIKWVDRDVLKKLFPDAEELIDSTFEDDYKGQEYEAQINSTERGDGFYYDVRSHRVRICECYYTMPEKKKIKVLNEETGKKENKEINANVMHYVIFAKEIILKGSADDHSKNEMPLNIDIYPLIPMYCSRTNKGLPKGLVSNLIDIQDQINKLNSKFLWTLMTNRIIAEEGALKDPDEARIEMQKPDGLVIVNDGGLGRIRVDDKYRDLSYMSNHLQFLLSTEQRISGVNDSMLGMGGTNERSGTMQSVRISQGAAMQTSIIENMYFSHKRVAQVVLRLIGNYYTDYRVVRITQPNGTWESYEFNKPAVMMPDGSAVSTSEYDNMQIPDFPGRKMPEKTILNKIEDILYYDVILKKVPPFTTTRERQLLIFSEVLKANVIPAPVAAEMMLTLSDMPHKEELIMKLQQFYAEQQQLAQQAAQAAVPAPQMM